MIYSLVLLFGGVLIALLGTAIVESSKHPKASRESDSILDLLRIHPIVSFGLLLMTTAATIWILQIS